MTSANEDTPKKLKSKKDPSRFLPPGLYFRGKFIGIEHVADACGDRSDMMCQVAMAKMKAAIKTLGDHKRRIVINISMNGIKILDEKDEELMFDHPLSRISYISRDISDSRAFGYVFNPGLDCHEFYGIKTEKAADVIVTSLSDLFQFVFSHQGKAYLSEDVSQYDVESGRVSSPPFSLRYGGVGEGGTLGRFKKSPRLLYRFYNTVSNVPAVAAAGSPRKQTGFLTLYNRQSSVPTNQRTTASPTTAAATAVAAQDLSANPRPLKTPSLSSSSSSNQNVNNSPSASALKSPTSAMASKKSLSSIGSSLPVIESPPNSPDTFKLTDSTSRTSPGTSDKGQRDRDDSDDDKNGDGRTRARGSEANISEDSQVEKQRPAVETPLDSSESTQVLEITEAFNGLDDSEQPDWANFEEFGFSDAESPSEIERAPPEEVGFPTTTTTEEEEEEEGGRSDRRAVADRVFPSDRPAEVARSWASKASHLALSFNGIDPFVDDPFFSTIADVSFDGFGLADDGGRFEFSPTLRRQQQRDPGKTWKDCGEQVEGEGVGVVKRESQEDLCIPSDAPRSQSVDSEMSKDRFFEDDFVPEMGSPDVEEILPEDGGPELSPSRGLNGKRPSDSPGESVADAQVEAPPETPRGLPLYLATLKSLVVLRSGACDVSPTSPSTNPSEFPSPDIPPPPLPPEAASPLHPTPPPPLPPRRPQWRKGQDDAADNPVMSSSEGDPAPLVSAQSSRVEKDEAETEDGVSEKTKPKLDTASILKLYSVPATSYFGFLNSASLRSTVAEEPTYGNLRTALAEGDPSPSLGASSSSSQNHLSFQSPATDVSSIREKEKSVWMGI